eukprot:53020-Eustigmatos_ZCMA.PRE.1
MPTGRHYKPALIDIDAALRIGTIEVVPVSGAHRRAYNNLSTRVQAHHLVLVFVVSAHRRRSFLLVLSERRAQQGLQSSGIHEEQ